MEPKIKKENKEEKLMTKNRYAQKKRSGRESVESVLKEKSLWSKGFVKQVGILSQE